MFENQVEQYIAKALHFSTTPQDSIHALNKLVRLYSFQADYINSLRYQILADNIMKKVSSPLDILLSKINDIDMFMHMGESDIAEDICDEAINLFEKMQNNGSSKNITQTTFLT